MTAAVHFRRNVCQIAAFGQHPVGRIAIRSAPNQKSIDVGGCGCSGVTGVDARSGAVEAGSTAAQSASCLTVESIESAYRRISWAPAVRHP
ncbi:MULTISPECIES: hypothetical protein [Rhodococcus]|uniref:hypothetical protein n=1 Tax=Rhodococcus TaxID=1827 RepID=UPI000DC026A1|nr:hypothetical protein [Rhodococcus sp. AQ5-07]RAL33784.1 hypothetical protein CVN56_12485 [Rhodococcus sp. AQ5-07]